MARQLLIAFYDHKAARINPKFSRLRVLTQHKAATDVWKAKMSNKWLDGPEYCHFK